MEHGPLSNIKNYIEENKIKSPYLKYARNVYSQFGDDGIIEKLLDDLNIDGSTKGLVVDCGAWDGIYISNVYKLWRYRNFKAVLIECDIEKYSEMIRLTKGFENVECICKEVRDQRILNQDSLDCILNRSKFDFNEKYVILSIDIDGMDYAIFDSIKKYYPIIICIEIAGGWKANEEYIGMGASLKSMTNLASMKGYSLVCFTGNAYFIRDDYLDDLKEYDKTLSVSDYWLSDDIVTNIMGNLDEQGKILSNSYFTSIKYIEMIRREKKIIACTDLLKS